MSGQAGESETFAIVGDHVVGEVFDGEAIIIDTITGAYYSMPDGAAQIWSALASGATTYQEIGEASNATAQLVWEVLSELVTEGLVVTEAKFPSRAAGATPHHRAWSSRHR